MSAPGAHLSKYGIWAMPVYSYRQKTSDDLHIHNLEFIALVKCLHNQLLFDF